MRLLYSCRMHRLTFVVAVLVFSTTAAQEVTIPGWHLAGTAPAAFELTLDREVRHSGEHSASVRCREGRCPGFATPMQTIRSSHYLEKRVRLSAWVKADEDARARIWMRIDGVDGSVLAFDNMEHRAKKGPFDWTLQGVVLLVPKDAALINYGLIVEGKGAAWIDDVVFEVVGKGTRTTDMCPPCGGSRDPLSVRDTYYKVTYEPVNLDFEDEPLKVMPARE